MDGRKSALRESQNRRGDRSLPNESLCIAGESRLRAHSLEELSIQVGAAKKELAGVAARGIDYRWEQGTVVVVVKRPAAVALIGVCITGGPIDREGVRDQDIYGKSREARLREAGGWRTGTTVLLHLQYWRSMGRIGTRRCNLSFLCHDLLFR